MPAQESIVLETPASGGAALRFVFDWRGDRYGHAIWLRGGDASVELLRSQEGDDRQHWPPSPPFQQLTIQHFDDGRRAALLVGMAGGSHWAGSVEIHGEAPQATFDVACRPRAAATNTVRLGSGYKLKSPSHSPLNNDGLSREWNLFEKQVMLRSFDAGLTLSPAGSELFLQPAGKRWRYEIVLCSR